MSGQNKWMETVAGPSGKNHFEGLEGKMEPLSDEEVKRLGLEEFARANDKALHLDPDRTRITTSRETFTVPHESKGFLNRSRFSHPVDLKKPGRFKIRRKR